MSQVIHLIGLFTIGLIPYRATISKNVVNLIPAVPQFFFNFMQSVFLCALDDFVQFVQILIFHFLCALPGLGG